MIEAYNLKKDFEVRSGTFFHKRKIVKNAVKDVSITVETGKIVGLLGINGAGKTTTIKMLTTMISPTSGIIQIDGIDAVKDYLKAKRLINLITGGERNLYWRLSARENLEYFGRLYGFSGKSLEERINNVLDIVKLEDSDLPVERYSKGMKQRLQIARGLINNPKYLFLDEPTLGLDVLISRDIHNYIKKLAHEEKKGILLTTHYIKEAEELCDYIYIIKEGLIVAEGTSKKIQEMIKVDNYYKLSIDKCSEFDYGTLSRIFGQDIEFKEEEQTLFISENRFSLADIVEEFNKLNLKILNVEVTHSSLENALVKIIE